jgi:uncharacterized protein (TIGR03083 family)
MIRTERAALVDALGALPDASWDQGSACAGWTVKQLVGHVTASALMTTPRFLTKLAGSGFRFNTMVDKDARALSDGRTPAQMVDGLRARIDTRNKPPGPALAMLGEVLIHSEDVFGPLSGYRPHAPEHVVAVLDFYKDSNLIVGAKTRIAGLRLRATDTDWATGDGPEVAGAALPLLLAMTGRPGALDRLEGDGVATLAPRLTA